jgi:hypothetical protein
MSVVFSIYLYSSTNKTDRYDITEMLLKVALNAKTILMSGLAILFMNGIPELFIIITHLDVT